MPQIVDDPTLDQLCDLLTVAYGYAQLPIFLHTHPADQPLDQATLTLYLRRSLWASARLAATLRGQPFREPWPV